MGRFTMCTLEMLLDNKNEEVEKRGICDTRERERERERERQTERETDRQKERETRLAYRILAGIPNGKEGAGIAQ